jgi:uncharacterized protein (TIGR00725 family)
MGGGETAPERDVKWAHQLGALIAQQDWVLLTGGRKAGCMEAASKGAKENGGLVIGIVMTEDPNTANDYVDVVIAPGMGSARNNINVLSSNVVIGCGATSAGTLSELALALKAERPVVLLNDDALSIQFCRKSGAICSA